MCTGIVDLFRFIPLSVPSLWLTVTRSAGSKTCYVRLLAHFVTDWVEIYCEAKAIHS